MTDYKNMCGWRRFVMTQKKRKTLRAVLFAVVVLSIYGRVGFLEQEPVVTDDTHELFYTIPLDVAAAELVDSMGFALKARR